jgi:hypothetical protein
MATTTGTLNVFDSYGRELHNKNVDVDSDVFIVGLTTSTWVPNKATHEALADVTNEVTGSGYVRDTLAAVTLTEPVAGTWRFDSEDAVFNASGGSIIARFWFMYNDTSTSPLDMLCFYGLLDDAPADVTTTDTNSLTIQVNASGYTEAAMPGV